MDADLTRRQILRGTAAGVGFAVTAGIAGTSSASAAPLVGEYDVVVVGSGAAGMTAALTAAKRGLSVVVVEKAPTFGGSAARSGSRHLDPEQPRAARRPACRTPRRRPRSTSPPSSARTSPAARQEAFLRNGPAMIASVMANSPLRFRWMEGYSDYYPELPGGLPNGRSIEPDQFDGNLLGAELANLNPAYLATPAGLVVFSADYKWLNLAAVNAKGAAVAATCLARGTAAALAGQKPLTMGQALAAGLRAGLLAANVPVLLNTPLTDLNVENGAVTGVLVPQGLIRARRGVIVGSGGFEHNAAMRAQYQRQPIGTAWTVGAKENTGDGHRAGQRGRRRARPDGRRVVGSGDPDPRRPVLLPGRADPARRPDRQPGRAAVRQRSRALQRRRAHDVRQEPVGAGHPRVAHRRPELPQQVPVPRHPAAVAVPGRLVQRGRGLQGVEHPGARLGDRRAGGGAEVHSGPVQRLRVGGRRPRLPARRERVRPLLHRPAGAAQLLPRAAVGTAVLRAQARPRRPGHEGRHAHGRPGARAAPGRLGDPRSLRRSATPARP